MFILILKALMGFHEEWKVILYNSAGFYTMCWNIVTSKNILYVSFVVANGPTGRTTCIIFVPRCF